MSENRRGLAARVGVVLLNLPAPGLGLLRLGQLRSALTFYAVSVGALIAIVGIFAATPTLNFAGWAGSIGTAILVGLSAMVGSMWVTWRESRPVADRKPYWSRWYFIVTALLLTFALSWILAEVREQFYRNFYLPSEGMEPTLMKGDKFVASMWPRPDFKRSDLALVNTPDGIYVKRLVGLPGDRIALKGGMVVLNGKPIAQRFRFTHNARDLFQNVQATVSEEQFPGETKPHLIQDLGPSEFDNFAEAHVKPGHVFMLGDNRDRSADSRVPRTLYGLEQVSIENVLGRPLFFYWPAEKTGVALANGAR